MCASGECSGCSILADLELELDPRCLYCEMPGNLVLHREELVHAECVEAFEVMTDNAPVAP
jgi:hypothetical protein